MARSALSWDYRGLEAPSGCALCPWLAGLDGLVPYAWPMKLDSQDAGIGEAVAAARAGCGVALQAKWKSPTKAPYLLPYLHCQFTEVEF